MHSRSHGDISINDDQFRENVFRRITARCERSDAPGAMESGATAMQYLQAMRVAAAFEGDYAEQIAARPNGLQTLVERALTLAEEPVQHYLSAREQRRKSSVA